MKNKKEEMISSEERNQLTCTRNRNEYLQTDIKKITNLLLVRNKK